MCQPSLEKRRTKLQKETDQGSIKNDSKWCMPSDGASGALCASRFFRSTKKTEAKSPKLYVAEKNEAEASHMSSLGSCRGGSHRVHAQKPRRVRRAKALPRRYLAVSVAVSAHCNCSASVGRPPLPGTSTHSTKSDLKNENPTRKLEARSCKGLRCWC